MRPRIATVLAQFTRADQRYPPDCATPTKEGSQRIGRCLRRALRKEVAPLKRSPLNVVGPTVPERQWSPLLHVPRIERTSSAPQRQDRAADATAADAIRLVMLAIDARRCPIFL